MRASIRSTWTVAATVCLVGVLVPLGTRAQSGNGNSDRATAAALKLEQKALALHEQPGRWAELARLYDRAGQLRPTTDTIGTQDLIMAAGAYYVTHQPELAWSTYQRASARALGMGDLHRAVEAYFRLSVLARQMGNAEGAAEYRQRLQLLSASPLISDAVRRWIIAATIEPATYVAEKR